MTESCKSVKQVVSLSANQKDVAPRGAFTCLAHEWFYQLRTKISLVKLYFPIS